MKKNFKLSMQLSNRASLRLQNSTNHLGIQSDKKHKRGGPNYSSVQGISSNSLQYSSTNKESNPATLDFKIEGEGVFRHGSREDSTVNLGEDDNSSSNVQIKNLNSQQKLQHQNEQAINKKPKIVLTQNNSVTQKEKKFNFGKNKSSVVTVSSPGGQEVGKELKNKPEVYKTPEKVVTKPEPIVKEVKKIEEVKDVKQEATTYRTEPVLDKKPSTKKIVVVPKKDIKVDLKDNKSDIESEEEEEVDPELIQYELGAFIRGVVKNFEGEIENQFQNDVDPSVITSFVKSELKNYEFNIHEGDSQVYTVGIPSEEVDSESLRGSNLQNLENQLAKNVSKESMELSNNMFGEDDTTHNENLSPQDLILEQKIKQELFYFIQEKIAETHKKVLRQTEKEIRDTEDKKVEDDIFNDNIFGMEDRIFQMVEDQIESEKKVQNDYDILAFVKNEIKGVGSFLTSDIADVEDIEFQEENENENSQQQQHQQVEMPKLNSVRGARRFSQGGYEDEINSFIQGETSRLLYMTEGNIGLDSPRRSKLDAVDLGEIGEEDENEDECSGNASDD